MTELASAVCSITATRRRRFFWAAWWTGAPTHTPFRKPDAANGGAATQAAALAEAEQVAGRHLTVVPGYWARAWMCVLRGQPVPALPEPRRAVAKAATATEPASAWAILGISEGASASAVRRAFHRKALETHPDQGGDAERFRMVMRAFERLTNKTKRRAKPRKRP